jgi:hypothetical protein
MEINSTTGISASKRLGFTTALVMGGSIFIIFERYLLEQCNLLGCR